MSAASRIAMALFVVALLTVIPYIFLKSDGPKEYARLQTEVERMRARNAELTQENAQLSDRLEVLRHNPRLIERQARERLHLARPDEVIFVFDEEPALPASTDAAPAEEAPPPAAP